MWLKSYLTNRRQYVKVGEEESLDFVVNSGVPQGSHIGPTVFLAFINDLPSVLTDDVFLSMFADDVRFAKPIKSPIDSTMLQSSIDSLRNWCDVNDLHLNLNKCTVLSIHRGRTEPQPTYYYGDHQLATTNEQRDLGVLIDNRLSFRNHTDMIVAKATSALGFLKRFCFNINDPASLKAIYYAFVQSNLDYCSSIWLTIPSSRAIPIESVLRQFTMYALREYPNASNNYQISSYDSRLNRLNMISVNRRRINNALIFLYDLINDNIHCPFVKDLIYINPNNHNFRNAEYVRISNANLRLMSNAPINLICKYANLIKNLFIEATSRNNFKKLLLETRDETFIL